MIRFQFDIDGIIRQDYNVDATEFREYSSTTLDDEYYIYDGFENILMTPDDVGRNLGSKFNDEVYNPSNTLFNESVFFGFVLPIDSSQGVTYSGTVTLPIDFDYAFSTISNGTPDKSASALMKGYQFDD
jgi:hypothetical protein